MPSRHHHCDCKKKIETRKLKAEKAKIEDLTVCDLKVRGELTQPVDPIVGVYNFDQVAPDLNNFTAQGLVQFSADGSVVQMVIPLLGLSVNPISSVLGSHLLGKWTKNSENNYTVTSTLICIKTGSTTPVTLPVTNGQVNVPALSLVNPPADPNLPFFAGGNWSRDKLVYNLTLVPGVSFSGSGQQTFYTLADKGLTTPLTPQPFNFTFSAVKVI